MSATSETSGTGFDITLDIFGQPPHIQIYTQISLLYAVTDASQYEIIVETLSEGLKRLTRSFPWLAGQIVNDGASPGNTGTFKITPLEKLPRLVVKDLRDDSSFPSMKRLRETNFPAAYLDENIIAPQKTLPGATSGPRPVFLLQASFIAGGLVLTFVAAHSAMDMTGQGQIMSLLSKACHGAEFTREELDTGVLRGRNGIPLLDDTANLESALSQQITEEPVSSLEATVAQSCTWEYFEFPETSLAALKSLASTASILQSKYVSTDDALTAYIWKSITRARLARLSTDNMSTLGRAVNVRRYLGIPETYVGFVQNMAYNTFSVKQLVEHSLGTIASTLQREVDPETSTLAHRTLALATMLDSLSDKSSVSFGVNVNPSTGLLPSSWAKVDCYGMDFNLGLGFPETVRRPKFDPFEGLIYLMPRTPGGEISAAVCLRDSDFESLKEDADFMQYVRLGASKMVTIKSDAFQINP
jgi:hypothetical protein